MYLMTTANRTIGDNMTTRKKARGHEWTGVRRFKEAGPLHDLLIQACPPSRDGSQSIPLLAEKLKMTPQGIYKWIQNGRVPPRQAVRVVQLSRGKVTLDDFTPYIFV